MRVRCVQMHACRFSHLCACMRKGNELLSHLCTFPPNKQKSCPCCVQPPNFMMNPVSWITGCRKGRCTFLERKICTLPALRLGDGPCSARRCRLGKDIHGSLHPGILHQHGEWALWGASSCCSFREMQSVVEPRSQTSGLEHFVCTGTALRGVQNRSAILADFLSPDA